MKYFPKISRGNVYLSPINPEDYEIFTQRMNDSRITDGIQHTSSITSELYEKEFLEGVAKDSSSQKLFSIVKKDKDELIGNVSLGRIKPIDLTATLGIFIGKYDEHNKGYGTDAVNAILFFGFNTLNLRSIDLHVYSFNKAAIKCYQKCGFETRGTKKDCHYCNGQWRDEIYMSITKEQRKSKNNI